MAWGLSQATKSTPLSMTADVKATERASRSSLATTSGLHWLIIKPHMTDYWVLPPKANAAFVAAMEDVLDVYTRPHEAARPLVCLDETSTQLIAKTRTGEPMRPGQPGGFQREVQRLKQI